MERVSEAGRLLVDRKAELKSSIRRETEELGRIEAALSALGVSWSGDSNSSPEGSEDDGGEGVAVDPLAADHLTEVGRLVKRAYRRQAAKKRKR